MPQISAITINDGSTTPVAHTFTPLGRDADGVFWWEQTTPAPSNKLGAIRIGYKQTRPLDAQRQLTAQSTVQYTVHVPTLETLGTNDAGYTPPPTVAYKELARVNFTLAERSMPAERKNARILAINLLGHAMSVANVDQLEPSYT